LVYSSIDWPACWSTLAARPINEPFEVFVVGGWTTNARVIAHPHPERKTSSCTVFGWQKNWRSLTKLSKNKLCSAVLSPVL